MAENSKKPLKKEFILTHVVRNVLSVGLEKQYSPFEEHFGHSWRILYYQKNGFLSLDLDVLDNFQNSSMNASVELKLISVNGRSRTTKREGVFQNLESGKNLRWGWSRFMPWDALKVYYMVDQTITLEAHVIIKTLNGPKIEKVRKLNGNSAKDVVFLVEGEKFHLSKRFLASESDYFQNLLFGSFAESGKAEIELKDVDSEDFRSFMEVLHGENEVEDSTLEGILFLADMYHCNTVFEKCENFLMTQSKIVIGKQFKLAKQYRMANLEENCLQKAKSAEDVQSSVRYNLEDLNLSDSKELLLKMLALNMN